MAIAVVWAVRNPVPPGDWRDLVEHPTFTQVFDSTRIFYTIGPAWSMAVEIMFYLFLRLAGSAFAPTRSKRGILSARSLVTLGLISYSVYLWHEPLLLLLGNHHWVLTTDPTRFLPGTAVLLAVSVVAGWFSYWGLEHPLASLRERLGRHGRLRDLYGTQPGPASSGSLATPPR